MRAKKKINYYFGWREQNGGNVWNSNAIHKKKLSLFAVIFTPFHYKLFP